MEQFQRIVQYDYVDFGRVYVRLDRLLREKGLTRNALSELTGIKWDVLNRYCSEENIVRVDVGILAKICYSLNCQVSDILEYESP